MTHHNDGARNPLEEPCGPIMQRLDQRKEWLKLNGERPDRLLFGPCESCDCCGVGGFPSKADVEASLVLLTHPSLGVVEHSNEGYRLTTTAAVGVDILQKFGGAVGAFVIEE